MQSNGVALVLNYTTMSNETYSVPLRIFYVKNDQLFWEVTITKYLRGSEYHDWICEIDAMNGTRIGSIG